MAKKNALELLQEISSIEPLPRVEGGFRTVLLDPPWQYDATGSRIAPDSKTNQEKGRGYTCLSNEALLSIDVKGAMAEKSHCYMWVTDAFLLGGMKTKLISGENIEIPFAPMLMRHYGFVPKCTLVWGKVGESGKAQIGMGNWFRHAHEILIFGVRGGVTGEENHSLPTIDLGSIFLATKSKHSKKPDDIYSYIDKMSQGPKLEMFAREKREGWTVWGNQIPEKVIDTSKVVHTGQE